MSESVTQEDIAFSEGNPTDPHHAVIALRKLADEHAKQLARGEKNIQKCNVGFREVFLKHARERVDLERRQCELLLRQEKSIPYGQRTTWKEELARSLTLTVGRGYSVTSIEARLTVARRVVEEPGLWDRALALLCLDTKANALNMQTLLKRLKPPKDDYEDAGPGDDPDDEPDDDEPDDDEVEKQLRSDVERADAVLGALDLEDAEDPVGEAAKLKALAARAAELEAENARLREEVERLNGLLADRGATPSA